MANREQRAEKREARKQARQNKVSLALLPFLLPEERFLCAPALGWSSPWAALSVQRRAVGELVKLLCLPLRLVLVDGFPAYFVVTDSRIIVIRTARVRVKSFPISEVASVTEERNSRVVGGSYGISSRYEVVDVRVTWRNQRRLRISFQKPWLSEGVAIGGAISRRHIAAEAARRDDPNG